MDKPVTCIGCKRYTTYPNDIERDKPKCSFNPFAKFFHLLPAAARGWGEYHLNIDSFVIKNIGIAAVCRFRVEEKREDLPDGF